MRIKNLLAAIAISLFMFIAFHMKTLDILIYVFFMGLISIDQWGLSVMKLFSLFSSKPSVAPVEQWAVHNSRKASADGMIASAIVASFAKDFKFWKFEGEFNQRHSDTHSFKATSLSRKKSGKKHITIDFIFKEKDVGDSYSSVYKYEVIGCEVNGIRLEDRAFKYISKGWNNIIVEVKRTEEVAAEAKKNMETLEKKWDLAEELHGYKRDKKGALKPIHTDYEPCDGSCFNLDCKACEA